MTEIAPSTTPPATAEDLFRFLDGLGIAHTTRTHPPVFTVAESESLRDEIPGAHTKNLFVKDKKDRYFVVTVEERAEVDLKNVHKIIGASSRVSFGRPEKMVEFLGVVPGSVTVFAAFNDRQHNVTFVIDEALMAYDIINGHPLSNDATTSVATSDLMRFFQATGHEPLVLNITG
ncbi:prolyl-tRNA synthetase associated domain-containing protein [Neorhizobium sp. NPDC001467]|uniref:prolyl-tRNA synthetase associated domain-containing protein n=1 Tax=Neorhizobium sp. NPDC001467 TaxID=3390595 RepID=UPI003CFFCA94